MDEDRHIHKSGCNLKDLKINELKIDHESELCSMKKAFDTLRAEKASALSSLDLEKKENEELQASLLELNKKIADLEKENRQHISNRQSYIKQFQDFTTSFVQALKTETQRILSLQHADLDFTPIIKITLRELGDIVRRERAASVSQPANSVPFGEGPSVPPSESFVPPFFKVEGSGGCSDDTVLALPIQREE